MKRIKKIIETVKASGEWSGKLNYNEITEIQKAGLFNIAKGYSYLVVDDPSKF